MKKTMFCVIVFLLATTAAPAGPGATIGFDPLAAGKEVSRSHLAGTCLPVWNRPGLYWEISTGLRRADFALFRFPNGSLSNEYHWNGSGSYTPDGIWVPDSTTFTPGFMSHTRYRGTSKFHYGFEGYSLITDGDTATFWWSDEQLPDSPHYFYVELSQTQLIDSAVIVWGERYGVRFSIDLWSAISAPSPGPHAYSSDLWVIADSSSQNTQSVYGTRLDSDVPSRFVRVNVDSSFGGKGVQVKEFYLYRNDTLLTRNIPHYDGTTGTQTRAVAIGAHGGNDPSGETPAWHFEEFMGYIDSIATNPIPVVCVNYATGTPAEAAAWVHYANRTKNFGITMWQIGNEMDGIWEEGGPITAQRYARRYLEYAKAMKAVDPAIKIFGPVLSNADFGSRNSGEYDGMSWMQSFISYVGAQEKADNTVYLDGVDFHTYPYWSSNPTEYAMMQRVSYAYDRYDSLIVWFKRSLLRPESTMVFLSEYNSSVVTSSLLQKPANGVFVASLLAGLAEKFGEKAAAVFWDSYEGMARGSNGTYGSLSMFNALDQKRFSSFGKAPSAAYWGLYTILCHWLSPVERTRIIDAAVTGNTNIQAFCAQTASSTRLLIINTGFDTVGVSLNVAGSIGNIADVYSWSEREFLWSGNDAAAYAQINCGPSSRRKTGSIDSLCSPPLSLIVVEFRDSPGPGGPQWIHVGASNVLATAVDPVIVYGSAYCPRGTRNLAFRVDTTGDFVQADAVDGLCDGPAENIMVRLNAATLHGRSHTMYLRVTDSLGAVSLDSVAFKIAGPLSPSVLIDNFEDRDLWNALPTPTRWNSHANGNNQTSIVPTFDSSVTISLSGAFSIVQPPTLGYDNFVTISTLIDTAYMHQNSDRFAGISCSYATSHSNSAGKFFLHILTTTVKDYDEFNIPLENTLGTWKTVSLRWEDFGQYGWGTPTGALDPASIRGIEFRAQRSGDGLLKIDNISFASDNFSSAQHPSHESVIESGSAPSLGFRQFPGSVCLDWRTGRREPVRIELFSVDGRLVHRSLPLSAKVGTYTIHVRKKRFAPGVYTAVLSQGPARKSITIAAQR